MDITSRLKTILKPYTALKPKDSLSDAVEWLLVHKKTLVPVVDNHRLIGVVKESNLFAIFCRTSQIFNSFAWR